MAHTVMAYAASRLVISNGDQVVNVRSVNSSGQQSPNGGSGMATARTHGWKLTRVESFAASMYSEFGRSIDPAAVKQYVSANRSDQSELAAIFCLSQVAFS